MSDQRSKGLHEAVFPAFRRAVVAAGGEWIHGSAVMQAALGDSAAGAAIRRSAEELGRSADYVVQNEIDWWKGTWWGQVCSGLEQRGERDREFRSLLPTVDHEELQRKRAERRRLQ